LRFSIPSPSVCSAHKNFSNEKALEKEEEKFTNVTPKKRTRDTHKLFVFNHSQYSHWLMTASSICFFGREKQIRSSVNFVLARSQQVTIGLEMVVSSNPLNHIAQSIFYLLAGSKLDRFVLSKTVKFNQCVDFTVRFLSG